MSNPDNGDRSKDDSTPSVPLPAGFISLSKRVSDAVARPPKETEWSDEDDADTIRERTRTIRPAPGTSPPPETSPEDPERTNKYQGLRRELEQTVAAVTGGVKPLDGTNPLVDLAELEAEEELAFKQSSTDDDELLDFEKDTLVHKKVIVEASDRRWPALLGILLASTAGSLLGAAALLTALAASPELRATLLPEAEDEPSPTLAQVTPTPPPAPTPSPPDEVKPERAPPPTAAPEPDAAAAETAEPETQETASEETAATENEDEEIEGEETEGEDRPTPSPEATHRLPVSFPEGRTRPMEVDDEALAPLIEMILDERRLTFEVIALTPTDEVDSARRARRLAERRARLAYDLIRSRGPSRRRLERRVADDGGGETLDGRPGDLLLRAVDR